MATDWRQTSTARPVSAAGASRLRPQRGMRAFSARSLSAMAVGAFFANGPESARTNRATTDEAWSGACVAADTNYGDGTWREAIGTPVRPVTSMFVGLSMTDINVLPWLALRSRAGPARISTG